MMDFVIKTITPKSGVMRSVHEEVLGCECCIIDLQVGQRGYLGLKSNMLHTSTVLTVERAEDDSWVEIETRNTFYRLEKIEKALEKYIVVTTINSELDACSYHDGGGHPCGICMCSDNNGEPFFAFVESDRLIDTYKGAKAVADKIAENMKSEIERDQLLDGWHLYLDYNGLCECFRDKAVEDGLLKEEDCTWLFKVDVHKVKVDKK